MFVEIIVALAALLAYYYAWFKQRTKYWAKMGVPTPKNTPFPFGNNPMLDWRFLSGKVNQVRIK